MIAHAFKAAPRENSPIQLDVHHVPLDVDLVSMELIVSPAHPPPTFKELFVKVPATQDTLLRATSANNVITLVQVASELLEPNVDHAMMDSS